MAIAKGTKLANRFGLDTKIYATTDTTRNTALLTLDYVNMSDIDISAERVFATGGQEGADMFGFDDPITGTFTLSTQCLPTELLALISGSDMSSFDSNTVDFQQTPNTPPKYYSVESDTVWTDDDGKSYTETLLFYKVCPRKALKIQYNGKGDPTSVDIVFDVMQNSDGKALTITRADVPAGGAGGAGGGGGGT